MIEQLAFALIVIINIYIAFSAHRARPFMKAVLIIIIMVVSFLITIRGGFALLLFAIIWSVCIIITLKSIVESVKNKKINVLNFIILFSVLSMFLGKSYVELTNSKYINELYAIADRINTYYSNNNEPYTYDKIYKIINDDKKIFIDKISENAYTIRSYKVHGMISVVYNSETNTIEKEKYR